MYKLEGLRQERLPTHLFATIEQDHQALRWLSLCRTLPCEALEERVRERWRLWRTTEMRWFPAYVDEHRHSLIMQAVQFCHQRFVANTQRPGETVKQC